MKDDKKLSEAARKARNEYIRQWRAKNKDKVREYRIKTWENYTKRLKETQDKIGGDPDNEEA